MNKLKRTFSFLLLACMAMVFCAIGSANADSFTVVPGRSVGKIQLGAARTAVLKILGKPSKSVKWRSGPTQDTWLGPKPPADQYGYADLPDFLNVIYKNNKVVQIEFSSSKFKTSSGISTRSSLAQFRSKYGKPRVRAYGYDDPNGGGYIGYYYDAVAKGIAFEFGVQDEFDATTTANSIRVHLSGVNVLPNPGGEPMEAKDEVPVRPRD